MPPNQMLGYTATFMTSFFSSPDAFGGRRGHRDVPVLRAVGRAIIYRGNGCAQCGGTGVKGRIGICEIMRMTPALRAMVGRGALAEDIHAAALARA